MGIHSGDLPPGDPPDALTSIHPRIHCAATEDTPQRVESELERLQIENFLKTLAEIAIAIASRNLNRNTKQD